MKCFFTGCRNEVKEPETIAAILANAAKTKAA